MPDRVMLAELTPKAAVLGIVLSMILAGANAYLGLFAGMTVSASIPAAVISMALLRVLGGTILENNVVQTAASAGESVAAGVIFTIPSLVLLGAWSGFEYWHTALLAGFGGILGVLFTIPLRRALVTQPELLFPEGVATAEVLKAGSGGEFAFSPPGSPEGEKARKEVLDEPAHSLSSTDSSGDDPDGARSGVRDPGVGGLVVGGILGAAFKLGGEGLRLFHGVVEGATRVGAGIVYVGSNLSPALLAVGYIVGLNIAVLVFVGGALNWFVAVPILAGLEGAVEETATDQAWRLWSSQTRYIGVGAMIVGGLWALVALREKLVAGIRTGVEAYRELARGGVLKRTERDIPMQWVAVALCVSLVPLFFVFHDATKVVWVSCVLAVVMLVAGFLFCAVAAYMAGLVGSSNNPVSGVTIATILMTSLLLLLMLGPDSAIGPAAAILVGSVVCCAAAIGGDNMQDLKAGRLLGATPYKQQIMQCLGVIAAALVMAPVLTLLLEAYGIGEPTAEHPRPLRAPQASLMAAVAKGVFTGGLPWGLVSVGMVVAVCVIALDTWLERRGSKFRTPVLAVAVGIYLPLELSVPILGGGLVAHAADRARRGRKPGGGGTLFAAGLITGEALVGILLAVPIVVTGNADVLAHWGKFDLSWPGVLFMLLVAGALYRAAVRRPNEA